MFETYVKKPETVYAIKVTDENLDDVFRYLNLQPILEATLVTSFNTGVRFIDVYKNEVRSVRTMIHPGKFVILDESFNIQVMAEEEFQTQYQKQEAAPEEEDTNDNQG